MNKYSMIVLGGGLAFILWGANLGWHAYRGQTMARSRWSEMRNAPAMRSGDVLLKLSFPRLNEERYVVAGATDENLQHAPAWMMESSLPARGNCIIAGHRDTHFRLLKNVRVGDTIEVDIGGKRLKYRVSRRRVVAKNDMSALEVHSSRDAITLVTYFPRHYPGPAPQRLIVQADREKSPVPLKMLAAAR